MSWDIKGKYCIVTGASSGIGKAIARGLALSGAYVTIVCRNAVRGGEARDEIIRETGNDRVEVMLADLSSQQQTRELAHKYSNEHPALHLLVNNAGVIMEKRVLTADGIETTFAVNYLAYYMLSNLLLNMLKQSAPSRIVNLTSAVHRTVRLDFANLQGERRYNRDLVYAQSKLADAVFSHELGRRLEGTGVTVNCVCPGAVSSHIWEKSSRLVHGFFNAMMKGPQEGAKVPLYVAISPDLDGVTCCYFQTGQHLKLSRVSTKHTITRSSPETYDREVAARLWRMSEKLTGVNFGG